ncbi:MAG: transporter YfdV [Bacteroidaceae bacterium]|nr:transporter YfdV [Bacteroidaceae bacterium]MBR5891298.1 transporter YfdV [Bacteroidaceae bacterium]
MIDILIKDILPIFVIMFLGYASGKSKVFSYENAQVFNKLVLNYALPAALFISIVKADRTMLFNDLKLTIISLVIITGVFLWSYFSCYKFFKHTKSEAAVCALISGSPTIGFLGFAVLEPIYGATASTGLVVAIISIVVNAINIPIGMALMNAGGTQQQGGKKSNPVLSALAEPVCWAPILAVIMVLLGIKFPTILDPNFELIAKANAGVAVFAAGLTLSGMKFQMDKEVAYNAIVKLVVMPGLLLLVGWIFGMKADNLQMMVLAGALPPAFSGIIIGSRYQMYVRTGTSSLAFSIFAFIVAAPLWIWIARMVAS